MIISANMATYPPRKDIIENTINSIYNQVDVLRIYLNEYEEIPDFCKREKIETVIGKNLRSAAKFYWALNKDEYYFSIDDDLLYPPTYVKDMLHKLNQYDDGIVVTLHGRIVKNKIKNYFKDGTNKYYRCLGNVNNDVFINVLGGGVSCFNTNNVKIDYKLFQYNYMDDITVSVQLQKQQIPILVMKHYDNYLNYNKPSNLTLYDKYVNNNITQTEVINSIKWELYKIY